MKEKTIGTLFNFSLKTFKNLKEKDFWSQIIPLWLITALISLALVFYYQLLSKYIQSEISTLTSASEIIKTLALKFGPFLLLAILIGFLLTSFIYGFVREIVRLNSKKKNWKIPMVEVFTNYKERLIKGIKISLTLILITFLYLLFLAIIAGLLTLIYFTSYKLIGLTTFTKILLIVLIIFAIIFLIISFIIFSFVKLFYLYKYMLTDNFSQSISYALGKVKRIYYWKIYLVTLLPFILGEIIIYIIYIILSSLFIFLIKTPASTDQIYTYVGSLLNIAEYVIFIFQAKIIMFAER